MARGTKTIKELERLQNLATELAKYRAVVGVFSTAQHPSGGGTVAEVAAKNHFGHGNTPARPFMVADQNTAEVLGIYKAGAKSGADAKQILKEVGDALVEQIRAKIRARIPPPNHPSTIRRKGSDVPLIDTETMINAVVSRVEPVRLAKSRTKG